MEEFKWVSSAFTRSPTPVRLGKQTLTTANHFSSLFLSLLLSFLSMGAVTCIPFRPKADRIKYGGNHRFQAAWPQYQQSQMCGNKQKKAMWSSMDMAAQEPN
jgi:hypothetical protein